MVGERRGLGIYSRDRPTYRGKTGVHPGPGSGVGVTSRVRSVSTKTVPRVHIRGMDVSLVLGHPNALSESVRQVTRPFPDLPSSGFPFRGLSCHESEGPLKTKEKYMKTI